MANIVHWKRLGLRMKMSVHLSEWQLLFCQYRLRGPDFCSIVHDISWYMTSCVIKSCDCVLIMSQSYSVILKFSKIATINNHAYIFRTPYNQTRNDAQVPIKTIHICIPITPLAIKNENLSKIFFKFTRYTHMSAHFV